MLNPGEFVETYAKLGAAKAKAPAARLFILGILAGFFIAMAGAATNTAAFSFSSPSAVKLVCGLLFPFGLVMVILTGAELFTGNCLMAISLLSRSAGIGGVLRNLVIVYFGNFFGALLGAAACVLAGQFELSGGTLAVYTMKLAAAKCSLSFGRAFLLGVLCNILVCTAVSCSIMAKSLPGKAVGAYLPICFFVLCGFEHCIANMYYIPAGLFAKAVPGYAELALAAGIDLGALSWGRFLLNNLLPVTLGNVAGGVGLAVLLWVCHSYRKEGK